MKPGAGEAQLVLAMERMLLATFPPLETASHGGLTVGSSHGVTGRANSAVVVGEVTDVPGAVHWAREWLIARERTPLFRLSPLAPPEILNLLGSENAYDTTSCMHLHLGAGPAAANSNGFVVEVTSRAPLDWISERAADGQAEVAALMNNVAGDLAWAVVRQADVAVAAGRGVFVDQWMCVQALYTLPSERGRGLGSAVFAALHEWAIANGATDSFLNVLATNTGAKSIYRRYGYEQVYDYTYVNSAGASVNR